MNILKSLIMILFIFHCLVLFSGTHDITIAVENGDLETVKVLLEKDAKLANTFDKYGNSLLYRAVVKRNTAIVKLLIKHGADVNAIRQDTGISPLHGAVFSSKPELVRLLIDKGADIDVRSKNGATPLTIAIGAGSKEIVDIIMDKGGRLNTEGYSGISILHSALKGGFQRIVDMILEKDKHIDFNSKTVIGNTLLHSATKGGLTEFIRMFVSKGLKVDEKNIYGQTPVHFAAAGGHEDVIRLFLKMGFDIVDEKNIYGQTPFHLAAAGGHKDVIRLFLKKGFDINVKTNDGRTPIHFAREKGKKEVEDFLIKKGAYSGDRQFPGIRGKYLGQKEPGLKPAVFAPGIISTNEFGEHSFPAFSPDYKEVYWSAYVRGKQTIFFMKIEDGKWSPPGIAPFSGKYDDGSPSFSFDGKRIYFDSNRPLKKEGKPKDRNIWILEKKGKAWSAAKPLSPIINTKEEECYATVTRDGTIYYKTIADLYRVGKVKGKFTKREKLDEINTAAFELGPYITPDESFIIFESNRPGGKGMMDLYICFRTDDSWSEAINLGDTINTEGSERFPGISPDGKFFFYLGHTNDIYWVSAKIIDDLKSKNSNGD